MGFPLYKRPPLYSKFSQDHYREKAVNIVTHTNVFFGYAVFLIITRPNVTNKSFPFTIRTSQVYVVRRVTLVQALPLHNTE